MSFVTITFYMYHKYHSHVLQKLMTCIDIQLHSKWSEIIVYDY